MDTQLYVTATAQSPRRHYRKAASGLRDDVITMDQIKWDLPAAEPAQLTLHLPGTPDLLTGKQLARIKAHRARLPSPDKAHPPFRPRCYCIRRL
jgi:hypothetical protein